MKIQLQSSRKRIIRYVRRENTATALVLGFVFVTFWMAIPQTLAQSNGRNRDMKAGKDRDISSRLTIISKPSGALVHLIGEYEFIGRTPFIVPYALYGRYTVKVNKRGYESIHSSYQFTAGRSTISIKMNPKTRGKAMLRSLLFPGWGQYYGERKLIGTLFVGAAAAGFTVLAINQHNYRSAQLDYQRAMEATQRIGLSLQEKQAAQDRVQEALREVRNYEDARNTSLYVAVGIWALNVLDSILFFPSYARDIEVFRNLGLQINSAQHQFTLQKRIPLY